MTLQQHAEKKHHGVISHISTRILYRAALFLKPVETILLKVQRPVMDQALRGRPAYPEGSLVETSPAIHNAQGLLQQDAPQQPNALTVAQGPVLNQLLEQDAQALAAHPRPRASRDSFQGR
jgi:hypothetical protein